MQVNISRHNGQEKKQKSTWSIQKFEWINDSMPTQIIKSITFKGIENEREHVDDSWSTDCNFLER